MTTEKLIGDPQAVRSFLWPYLKREDSSLQSITAIKLHSLGSVAAGRGVVKITVQVKTQKSHRKTIDLFANYDQSGGSKTIFQFLEYVHHHGFGSGAYGAPTPLCYSTTYKLLIYRSFPGRRVRDELEAETLSPAGLNSVMRQSAIWMKKFHRLPPQIGRPKNLRLAPAFFSALTAPHRHIIATAVPYINRELARQDRRSLVHGDPHLANCIRGAKGSFAFIDFSESHIGSAAADIAMYLVHLDVALNPFFSRRIIGQAQRMFLYTYFGRPVERLSPRERRAILAFELRTAALFLRFTSDHHRRPAPQVAWMIQRFITIVADGTDELRRAVPKLILAS